MVRVIAVGKCIKGNVIFTKTIQKDGDQNE
jgi:hypothetical protein